MGERAYRILGGVFEATGAVARAGGVEGEFAVEDAVFSWEGEVDVFSGRGVSYDCEVEEYEIGDFDERE